MIGFATSGQDSQMVCHGSRLDCTDGNFLLYNAMLTEKTGSAPHASDSLALTSHLAALPEF